MNERLEWLFNEILPSPIARVILAFLAFGLGIWLAKRVSNIVGKAMSKGHADPGLISFLKSMSRIAMQILSAIAALSILGMPMGEMVTFIGALAVAVGLALRDSMSNVASGIIILFTKPFSIGDFIEIEAYSGTVTNIAVMSTRLLTADNKWVVVPNSMLTTNMLVNYSKEPNRRVDMLFTIGYGSDLDLAEKLILQCAEKTKILAEPAPRCVVKEHSRYGVVLGTIMWCRQEDYLETTYEMNRLVKLAFDEAGVHIPECGVIVTGPGM